MNIFRNILHCKTKTSDKVYILEVNHIDKQYTVLATWGKRDAPRLSSQIKGEYSDQRTALRQAEKWTNDKIRGKDNYKLVNNTDIKIPGHSMKGTTVDKILLDNNNPSTATINKITDVGSLRKIKM
jgi:hypothetical protein